MACKIENIRYKGRELESKLGEQLIDIFKDVDRAKEEYDKIASSDFTSKFGDWVNSNIEEGTNVDGEPIIITDIGYDNSKHYYIELPNGERFDILGEEFSSFDQSDLTNEIGQITEQIAYHIYKKHFSSDFEIDPEATFNVKKEINNFANKKISEWKSIDTEGQDQEVIDGIESEIDYYEKIKSHADEFEAEIIKFFASKRIAIKEREIEDTTQESLEEGLQGGDIRQSFERNSKENATANVKLMLSFLPRTDNITGELVEGDYIIDEPLFHSFDSIHSELQQELSDITTFYTEGKVSDVYQMMYNKIKELSKRKKTYNNLLKILDNVDDQKRTEFIQAFYLTKVNFYTTTFSTNDNNGDYYFKVQNVSTVNDPVSKKYKDYYTNFKSLFVQGGMVNKKGVAGLSKRIQDVLIKSRQKNRKQKLSTDEQFYDVHRQEVEELFDVLHTFGVHDINDKSIDVFLKGFQFDNPTNSYNIMYSKLIGTLTNLKDLLDQISTGKVDASSKNPFEHFSGFIFKSLAEAQNFVNDEKSEATIFSNGKTYWTFKRPSYISNVVNKFKQAPDAIRNIIETPYGSSSVWAKHLLGEEKTASGDFVHSKQARDNISNTRLEKLSVGIFNSFQEQNKGEEGSDNKSISFVDQSVDRINKVMRAVNGQTPIYSTITPADKSTMHEIAIDYFQNNVVSHYKDGDPVISDNIINIFTDYFFSEVDRMKTEYQQLSHLDEKDLVLYYHTDKSGNIFDKKGKLAGNAFKLGHIFTELSHDVISDELNEKLKLYDTNTGAPMFHKNPETKVQRDAVKPYIHRILKNAVNNSINKFYEKGLVKEVGDGNVKGYTVLGVDNNILDNYKVDPSTPLTKYMLSNLIADYSINSIIANVEYTKLFTGDPSFYKNMVDFFKRVPATYTDGTNLRLGITENDHYFKMAPLKNVVIESEFIDRIKDSLETTDLSKEEKDYILSSYSNVNQTDAQGYITPDRWAFLISRTGKWNSSYASVYDKMKSGEALDPSELKTVMQPLKGVYFGMTGNIPVFLKYSQAVLIPQLIQGTQLETLARSMSKSNVDEAVVIDGIKVGPSVPNDILDEKGNIMETNLSSQVLNNSDWKLQQDLPTKTIKPTLLGSQIQKNIYSSLDVDNPVHMDLKQRINDVLSRMSNMNITELSNELGLDNQNRIDYDSIYSMLERELIDRKSAVNLLRAVQKNLPIEATPGIKDKLYNILFSKVRTAAVKLKTNGASLIQVSNFGLDKVTADKQGVTWLTDPASLRPPLIEQDAEGNRILVPGQVFIPHSQLATLIPNYREYTMEELNQIIDKKALRAIGYRIPNQGQSSNDPLQIVGILPPHMGDSVVAYSEITTKTGSDFDIDKMYVMLPNITFNKSKATYKKANDYINEIELTTEEMYDELVASGYPTSQFVDMENVEQAIRSAFIEEHIFDTNSELEYHDEFMSKYNIGDVNKISFVEYNENLSENNNKQLQNLLFDLYWEALTLPTTYGDLITPIDFPHIKNKIESLFGTTEENGRDLIYYEPFYQLDLKFRYVAGKTGVGVTANMLVDHNRSKDVGMAFNNTEFKIGHPVFDMEYSEEMNGTRYKIRESISAFLNAFVDIAKDPYIATGNFNSYTSSVTFMLIRLGVHPDWIVSFIGHPALKELVEFTDIYESKTIPKEDPSLSSYDVVFNNLLKEAGITVKQFREIEPLNLKGEIDITNVDPVYKLQILDAFDNFKEYAKKLNESVQLSRFDTLGAGTNLSDLLSFSNRIKDMYFNQFKRGELIRHFEKYKKNDKLTSLGTQVLNTVSYLEDLLDNNPDLFLLGSLPIRNLGNEISRELLDPRGGNRGLLTDEKLSSKYFSEVYKYIMSDFAPFKVEDPIKYVQDTKEELLKYRSDEEVDNEFLDALTIYENSFGIDNKSKSVDYQDILYRSSLDLYKANPELANRIYVSSFLLNGFETRLIDIKEYIPYQWFIENGIREFIRSKNIEFKDNPVALSSFYDQFIKNNWQDNKIVPKADKVYKRLVAGSSSIDPKLAFEISFKDAGHLRYKIDESASGIPVMVKYVKVDNNLYKLYSYGNDGAQYVITDTSGFTDRQSFVDMKFYKYGETQINPYITELTSKRIKAANDFVKENLTIQNGFMLQEEMERESDAAYEAIKQTSVRDIVNRDVNINSEEDFTQRDCK